VSGIYIHIPFCAQACHYCDFHFSTDQRYRLELVEGICEEVRARKDYLNGQEISTIYFGGGTPSVLKDSELGMIMESLNRAFTVSQEAEITLEANPEDLSLEKVKGMISLGVNRLSIGIQSFHEETLRSLNRSHDSEQAKASLSRVKEAGINNLNADLIFAIPGRSLEILKEDVNTLMAFQPEHISAYGLTIEEKTAFGKWSASGKFKAVSEEQNALEFEYLMEALPVAGLEQYEISNFARRGFESRHNSSYWKRNSYLGLGPGAHSFDGKSRAWNVANNHQYLRAIQNGTSHWNTEVLSEKDKINEYLMTSLRMREGCNLEFLKLEMEFDLIREQSAYVEKLLKSGLSEIKNNSLILTKKGKMIADQISSDLFVI